MSRWRHDPAFKPKKGRKAGLFVLRREEGEKKASIAGSRENGWILTVFVGDHDRPYIVYPSDSLMPAMRKAEQAFRAKEL